MSRSRGPLLASAAALVCWVTLSADAVVVQRTEGTVHGFLALSTLDGTRIADGDLTQVARADNVTTRLAFSFKDGSRHEETAVYSQRGEFRLLSDHLVQTGPAFPRPLDMTLDGRGDVIVRYVGDRGEQKVEAEHFNLQPDVSNGVMITLLKNLGPGTLPTSLSYVAITPKPRLVKLVVTTAGEDRFSTGGAGRAATHYVLAVDIGGVSGFLAPLVGKQPPDSHVWILRGEAPAFVKSEQPLYFGGPIWRIELVTPMWPRDAGIARR